MTKLTRRRALGLAGGGALGLAGCQRTAQVPDASADGRVLLDPDRRAPYVGSVSFVHGVASGDPLTDRVVFWTRVTRTAGAETAIPVSLGVYEDRGLTRAVILRQLEARPASDYTVKVDVDGLKPGKTYYYRFTANVLDGPVYSPVGRTRTLADGGTAPVKLAVISCSNYPFGFFNVYGEIGRQEDLDAVVHLGDYLYEYGPDGYGGEAGEALGRQHQPAREITTLVDYRQRHAQYKTDPQLQAAHAAAPWICTWDDHESANDSYRTGAQNHDPATEGDWTDRKQRAVQAYLEWMPVRDPVPNRAREALWRSFNFGDVATIHCLESRLTGRSDELNWNTILGDKAPEEYPATVQATLPVIGDAERTMLGAQQEAWLAEGLRTSAGNGKTWQVLANQVIMARVRLPNFTETLTPDQIGALGGGFAQRIVGFSQLGLPFNLDAWDGFPAARARLYASAKAAGARLVTLTGDTHTAWANTLIDDEGEQRGVEFGTTSVTSPGFGSLMPTVDTLGTQFSDANPEVEWHDPFGSGFMLVTLTEDAARADYMKVSSVVSEDFTTEQVASFETRKDGAGQTPLARV